MYTQILPQTNIDAQVRGGAHAARRRAVLTAWQAETDRAIAALYEMRTILRVWERRPGLTAGFNVLLSVLAEAGLLSWADNGGGDATGPRKADLDKLAAVLGVDRE